MTTSAVKSFREFANEIRQPAPYYPLITELKGITNLGLGSIELLASQYMKYSKNPHFNKHSTRHVEIGKETIHRGFVQFMPGFILGISVACLYRK